MDNRPKSGHPMTKFKSTGGHKTPIHFTGISSHIIFDNGIQILDPLFSHPSHIVNDLTKTTNGMKDYLNGVGNKIYSVSNVNGHTMHRHIMIRMYPQPAKPSTGWQPNQFVYNDEAYQYKSTQTTYSWVTEDDNIYELAHALTNMVLDPSLTITKVSHHDVLLPWVQKTYVETLIDGITKVSIKHVNYHRYNLKPEFYNHYSYFHVH